MSPILKVWGTHLYDHWHFSVPILISVSLVSLLSICLTIQIYFRASAHASTSYIHKSQSGASARNDRRYGVWTPKQFDRPSVAPSEGWTMQNATPLPYRPFRYGPQYRINMGVRSMDWNEWIEIDRDYPRFHTVKARRIFERGARCCKTANEAFEGALELLEELAIYLPQRYPTMFESVVFNGSDIVGIRNLWSNETFDIRRHCLKEDPMQVVGRLIQEDVAIMFEKDDGQYYLLAGSILVAGSWRLEDKFGLRLSDIHTTGDVPGYKEKLERGMSHLFQRLKPESPMQRNNYSFQMDDNLDWSHSLGPEDMSTSGWANVQKDLPIENHYFRSERQTLRRLPRTGGIVFTIRTYLHPVTEIAKEAYVPGRLAAAVRSWTDEVSRYKGGACYSGILLQYLDEMHEQQLANGLNTEGQEIARQYPF